MIPYGRQTIEEDDIQIVVDVLRSDYLTTGPKVAEFENLWQIMSGQNMLWRFQMIQLHYMQPVMRRESDREMK